MECLENEQNFFELLDAGNNWQGNINDFVLSSETVKEEPIDDGVEDTENETVEEKPVIFVVVNDSESVIENPPDFVLSGVEEVVQVQDDIKEEGDQQDPNAPDEVCTLFLNSFLKVQRYQVLRKFELF